VILSVCVPGWRHSSTDLLSTSGLTLCQLGVQKRGGAVLMGFCLGNILMGAEMDGRNYNGACEASMWPFVTCLNYMQLVC